MPHRIFVYGTLKRGGSNHAHLAAHRFVAEARTAPGFRLYELEGYPGMVADPTDRDGVTGELWEVDEAGIKPLDDFEGVGDGLYRRERVPLVLPTSEPTAEAYVYARDVSGRRRLGPTWPV